MNTTRDETHTEYQCSQLRKCDVLSGHDHVSRVSRLIHTVSAAYSAMVLLSGPASSGSLNEPSVSLSLWTGHIPRAIYGLDSKLSPAWSGLERDGAGKMLDTATTGVRRQSGSDGVYSGPTEWYPQGRAEPRNHIDRRTDPEERTEDSITRPQPPTSWMHIARTAAHASGLTYIVEPIWETALNVTSLGSLVILGI